MTSYMSPKSNNQHKMVDPTAVPPGEPSMQASFHTFSPKMESLYGGAQLPTDRKRGYNKIQKYIQLSGNVMKFIPPSPSPSPEPLDQHHPSASPELASGSQSHPQPSSVVPPSSLPPSDPPTGLQLSESMPPSDVALPPLAGLRGSPESAEESHNSEDSQYNKLLEEIIQWA
ncbi:hypothetical protein EDB19DRAFT_1916270 [Suillus lakei]|nr:hypothetical protein EDB19DRAFT_1916270 [Suillus lakei]